MNPDESERLLEESPALPAIAEAREKIPTGSARKHGYVRRVVGSTFNYGLGSLLPQLIRFPMFLVFSQLISPRGQGFIELSNRFGAFLVTPMRLGVPSAVSRFYFDYDEGPSLRDYVTTITWCVLVSSMTVAIAAVAFGPWILHHLIPELPFIPFALLAIVSATLVGINEMQDRLVQAREQSAYAARLNIGRTLVSIVLAVFFVIGLRLKAEGLLAAEVASYGLLALVAAWYLRSDLRGRFNFSLLRPSFAYGMAMIPSDFANSITLLVSQVILANAQSVAASGLLVTGQKFSQPLTLAVTAFGLAFNPIYFSIRKEASAGAMQRIAETARNIWGLAIFGALGAALIGPSVLILLMPISYHPAAPLIPVFAILFLGQVVNSLFCPEIYYSKKTWLVPIVVYSGCAVQLAVTALTARRFGPIGVAFALTAQAWVTSVILAVFARRMLKVPHQWFSLIRITLCGALVGSGAFWIPYHHRLVGMAIALAALAVFPLLLLITGDSSVREGYRLARRILARLRLGSA